MELLPLVAAIAAAGGALPYIVSIIRGSVRPRIISWAVWTVLAAVMTYAAFMEGQRESMLLSLSTFVGCFAVLALGWRQGNITLSRLDIVCGIGALAGIASLFVLRNPTVALGIAVAVDAIAFIPTLVHAWREPYEESLACFALAATGGILALVAGIAKDATLAGVLYPIYAVVFNGVMVMMLIVGRAAPLVPDSYDQEEVR